MKNETKNTVIKTSSHIGMWLVYGAWIVSIFAVIEDRNPMTLMAMGIMSIIALAAIFEDAKIQSRVDLFDGSEDLKSWDEFCEIVDEQGGIK